MTNYYPVEEELSAYSNDLQVLFTSFDKAGSLRYEVFCREWRKLNFSFIHCGKKSSGDKNQGTERLLRCISGYLNPETQFQFRIAAIYAAYSVYYSQICEPKVKIRMTVPMWTDLKDIQKLLRDHKHHDVDYVINKMENDNAFVFTAMPKQLEYGNKELMTNMETHGSQVNTLRKYYVPEQYIEDTIQGLDFIESIACLEDEYLAVKSDLMKKLPKQVDVKTTHCLSSIKDLRSSLVNEIEEFQEWVEANTSNQMISDSSQRPAAKRSNECDGKSGLMGTGSSTEKQPKANSRAERIRSLKNRSFRNLVSGEISEGKDTKVSTEDENKIVYRRSALLEKREIRPWLRRWKSRQKKPVSQYQCMQ